MGTAVMAITPHQAKYFAHGLTRRGSAGLDRLSMSLFDAAVDLNPHQIEAALFALQSPLSRGVKAFGNVTQFGLQREHVYASRFKGGGVGRACVSFATAIARDRPKAAGHSPSGA